MLPPAHFLEGAELLAYAHVPESAWFTGRLHLYSGSERVGRVPNLAICRPDDEPSLMLLHCDESWNIIGVQAWNAPGIEPIKTLEAMKVQAERYYEGLIASWKEVPSGDA